MKELSVVQSISSLARPVSGALPENGRIAGQTKKGERLPQGVGESETSVSDSIKSASNSSATSSRVEDTVNELNQQLALSNRSIRFHIDEKTDILVVSVIDDETGETIRQLPPEVTIKLAEYREGLSGLLANVKG